jgi:beta-glucosidase
MEAGGNIEVSVQLTNTGSKKGKEVVQLYLRDMVASTTRPIIELKGFELVELEPGASKTVSFNIGTELLEFYNANKEWTAEPGQFEVMVGGNSKDLKTAKFRLK